MTENENPIGFGIIGCAEIARKVSRAIHLAPNATLVAVASRSIHKAKQFAVKNKLSDNVKLYGSYDELLDDPLVDAVYMPLPTSLHVKWAVIAARKGKHLLLEKPTALDVKMLDEMLEACESNQLQFMDASMWYHHPRTAKMKELLLNLELFGHVKAIFGGFIKFQQLLITGEYIHTGIGLMAFLRSASGANLINLCLRCRGGIYMALGSPISLAVEVSWVIPVGFMIHSSSSYHGTTQFLQNDIRVKPDLDALGALGDAGWYCIGAILWTMNQKLPTTVAALPTTIRNSAGVILSCNAALYWDEEQTVATFYCSFVSHETMDLAVCGSNGTLHVEDFIIPYEENCATFSFTSGAKFVDMHIGWNVKPHEVQVATQLPQEGMMIQEFSRLVKGIKDLGLQPDTKWAQTSRVTQLVLDAVKNSIDNGYKAIQMYGPNLD
ncbi:UNVERIFIED_CONTAM: putative oxidoreductase [Sesamum radiatum]|uniref:Oxidoreductase n=1 Tax=Sesamum radiatum TaxID=300843 RepID=A0AAW2P2X5_SESRA